MVAELSDGRWFGEMTLITGESRSAAARAKVDTDLLLLTRASFHSLLARMPVLGLRLSEEFSRRLRGRLVSESTHRHRVVVLEDPIGTAESAAAAVEIGVAIAEELGSTVAYVDLGDGAPASPNGRLQHHRCNDLGDVERLCRSHGRHRCGAGGTGLSGCLLRGAKKHKLLAELTGGARFEDLGVPLWIVAADLVLQREFVFDRGDLGEALDATSAIPTVFPVVSLAERQLVDGWVVNPLPADVLRHKDADIVIGVDPNVADERAPRPRNVHRRRPWWRRLLNPRTLIDPMGMVRVAMQAMDVGARERTMANLALTDVCVQPALPAIRAVLHPDPDALSRSIGNGATRTP